MDLTGPLGDINGPVPALVAGKKTSIGSRQPSYPEPLKTGVPSDLCQSLRGGWSSRISTWLGRATAAHSCADSCIAYLFLGKALLKLGWSRQVYPPFPLVFLLCGCRFAAAL